MADRNDWERGGRDYDERNRWGGRDPQGEGRGREWGAGEREGQGREAGVGRGYAEENRSGNDWYGRDTAGRESWGSDRGYGRDIDWRTDWRQGQAQRAQQGQGPSQQGQGQDWSQDRSRQGGAGQGWNPQGRFGSQGGYGVQQNRPESRPGSWAEGPHSGKGPQGYQRSNERIHEEVCEALTRHSQVDASNIRVRVENGEITLEGTVASRREKRMAEEAVENLSGVRDVHNHLRVGQPSSGSSGNGGTLQETSAAHQAGLEEGSGKR
jgi:osmotically-inducible protein OsmY